MSDSKESVSSHRQQAANLALQAERLSKAVDGFLFNEADQDELQSRQRIRGALTYSLTVASKGGSTGPSKPAPEIGDPRFFSILKEMGDMHRKKGADYGLGEDFLSNLRASEGFGIPAWVGTLIRTNDKMTRLKSLCQKGRLENESAEDSLVDMACYSVLALILLRESKQKDEIASHFGVGVKSCTQSPLSASPSQLAKLAN
jgi:hypothetical protein